MAAIVDFFPECHSRPVVIRFDSFVERVLYDPQFGYYSRPELRFGKTGDFYTSPNVHFFFAEILAEQFLQVWELLGCPADFMLLEMGPGDGTLAWQILTTIRERFSALDRAVRYLGLEASRALGELQRRKLAVFPRARVLHEHFAGAAVPRFDGCIFSNEFLDALPFRRFRKSPDGWLEFFVQVQTERLEECWVPTDWESPEAAAIPAGGILEWRDSLASFYEFASAVLSRGIMLHCDYGDRREDMVSEGTLRTYFQHQWGDDPFVRLGEQDITASVDFSHLLRLGDQHRFRSRLLGQRQYLLERGVLEKVALRFKDRPPDQPDVIQEKLAIKDLILPGGISDHFKVLIQERT